MWLPDQVFKTVISSTPLISIDLVVRNGKGEVLLGKRLNAPAKGYWLSKYDPTHNLLLNYLRDMLFKSNMYCQ